MDKHSTLFVSLIVCLHRLLAHGVPVSVIAQATEVIHVKKSDAAGDGTSSLRIPEVQAAMGQAVDGMSKRLADGSAWPCAQLLFAVRCFVAWRVIVCASLRTQRLVCCVVCGGLCAREYARHPQSG